MTTVQWKRLDERATMPSVGSEGAAGLDLYALSIERQGNLLVVRTGWSVAIPAGYVGLLFPRSSICSTDVRLANSVGVIDSDYRGEIVGKFDILNCTTPILYKEKHKALQLVVVPCLTQHEIVGELDQTTRGARGFGSSGV